MAKQLLCELGSLLALETSLLQKLSRCDWAVSGDEELLQLSRSLQHCGVLLSRLARSRPSALDEGSLAELRQLKGRREHNLKLLLNLMHAAGKKIAALKLEQKALNSYYPPQLAETRHLDCER